MLDGEDDAKMRQNLPNLLSNLALVAIVSYAPGTLCETSELRTSVDICSVHNLKLPPMKWAKYIVYAG